MTLEDADLRTLPRRAGAGSYGALSRPAENVSQMHAASAGLGSLEGLAKNAPVAQLDRALDYESRGQEFESLRARQHLARVQLPRFAGPFAKSVSNTFSN